jgi:hypothetical protein
MYILDSFLLGERGPAGPLVGVPDGERYHATSDARDSSIGHVPTR